MRRNVTVALAILFVLGGGASAREQKPLRIISVSGTVETKVAPDQIVWRISLVDTDKDMRAATARSDEKISSVVALRETLGVDVEDISTGSVSIRREYERDERGGRGDFKHFVVRRSVTIRQRDLKRFDEFLDALVASAEMEVGFNFATSRIHEIRAETRLKALQVAKDKAEAMVQVVGAKLGRVLTIDEHGPENPWQSPLSNAAVTQSKPSVDLATEKFVPGAISVQVTVYATFEIE